MGICLDIAALTACMFRAVGMTADVAIGSCTSVYKNGDREYRQKPVKHAWNEIVVNGKWVTWDQMIAQKNRNSTKEVWTANYKVSHIRK
jgi:transglutaminase-like putative cysteine protease